ncbi:MAG TPA: glycosyltransferase family 2 protein [Pseudonocardiaceae bacterium]
MTAAVTGGHPGACPVDVLIPTCDRPAELATTLAGLAAQHGPGFRVVVSDQSAGPPAAGHPAVVSMARVLTHQGRPVRFVRHLPRRGLAEHRAHLLGLATAGHVLFLDDDVWLRPGALERLYRAIRRLGCGLVGYAVQGLSYLDDRRPHELAPYSEWECRPRPERVLPGSAEWGRWTLHNAANLVHLAAELRLRGDEWRAYRIAWVGGCVLYERAALEAAGGFGFWPRLPAAHAGEDVYAQLRVLALRGGAGILPSGAVHLESPTTVPDRRVNAVDVLDPFAGIGGAR